MWRQQRREHIPVARCTVARLMNVLGLCDAVRGKVWRTTISVGWFNHRRLLEPIGYTTPAEMEMAYYRQTEESAMVD